MGRIVHRDVQMGDREEAVQAGSSTYPAWASPSITPLLACMQHAACIFQPGEVASQHMHGLPNEETRWKLGPPSYLQHFMFLTRR